MSVSHEERAHAKLSASGANRWMNCPLSPQIEELFPEIQTDASQEGTLAHEFSEIEIRNILGTISAFDYNVKLADIKQSKYFNESMYGFVEQYVDYVIALYNEGISSGQTVSIMIETRLDLGSYIPEGFGTSDIIIRIGSTLHVIDLKYGFVYVNAFDNPQLKIYAVGALDLLEWDFDIENVVLHIVQPRIGNISTYEIDVNDLAHWAETDLKTLARDAYNDGGYQKAGLHCQYCKASASCKVLKDEATTQLDAVIEKGGKNSTFKLMTQREKSELFLKLPVYKLWVESFSKHMEHTSLSGVEYEGLKTVEGISRRVVKDEKKLIQALEDTGIDDEMIFVKKLIPIGEIERLFGKDWVAEHVKKPKGKRVLAAESDKRKVYVDDDLEELFGEEIED